MSTGEVKDAVRLAQQYNIQIYRYLIDGLVNQPLKVSELKAELEEYTRSSMKFFVRLLQIRNSRLPFVRVREEQINVFREQMQRNDRLRQEVHNVQRGLWRLREMGRGVPMADQHMIIQGFPELCVSTSPGKVPLTVLCDQILHKYNLRNERHIMGMLHWADEQSEARKVTRQTQSSTAQESSEPESCVDESTDNDEKKLTNSDQVLKDQLSQSADVGMREMTPVPSWCDFDQLFPTDDGMNEVTPAPSWCDFEQNQVVTISLQEMTGHSFVKSAKELEEVKESGSEIIEGKLIDQGTKTSCSLGKETKLVEDTNSFKASPTICKENRVTEEVREDDGLDELMSVLQDIPELEPDYTCKPALNSITRASVSSEMNSAVLDITGTQHKPTDIANTNLKQQRFTENKNLHQFSYPDKNLYETYQESFENMKTLPEPTPGTAQVTEKSQEEELVSNTTKPVLRDLHKLKEIQSTVKESLKEVIAGIIRENSGHDITTLPTALSKLKNRQTMHREFPYGEACKNSVPLQETQKTSHTEESKVSVDTQKAKDISSPLVGSDKPHVYENKIKRKQHGPSSVTRNMTAGEILEYEKKREEALQAVELKKQRTKLLLNQQFEKSSQKNSLIHYHKVQNTPKPNCYTKPATVPTSSFSNNRNDQICKSTTDSGTVFGSISFSSRKRSASSVITGSIPKKARSSKPRIILRIFRDEDDWNVEQVIDRY